MSKLHYTVALLCVLGLAVGQLLFKLSAQSWARSGSLFSTSTVITLSGAMLLYAVATIAWVWALQSVPLGRAYPMMALAFVLVPIGSYFLLGERFEPRYFAGIALIIAGILVCFWGQSR